MRQTKVQEILKCKYSLKSTNIPLNHSITCKIFPVRSLNWLNTTQFPIKKCPSGRAVRASDFNYLVWGLNPAEGRIQLTTVLHFIAQSFLLSSFHRPDKHK